MAAEQTPSWGIHYGGDGNGVSGDGDADADADVDSDGDVILCVRNVLQTDTCMCVSYVCMRARF